MEGFCISNLALLDKCDDDSKFWIVNVSPDYISKVVSNKVFSALSEKSRNIYKFSKKDIVILNTKINGQFTFIGVSMVDRISVNDRNLFSHFMSSRKIHLKSIKFFENSISYSSIKDMISVKGIYVKEFIEISREDIIVIMSQQSLMNNKPLSLSSVTFSLDDFCLHTIELVFESMNKSTDEKMVLLKSFIKNIQRVFNNYGISVTMGELEDFYSRNIWRLNYKHVPSRDPDSNIRLYDAHGKSKNFGYIILNRGLGNEK